MKTESILQSGFWLLGFTIAFFAFVARDRRMPSVANTIYSSILIVFLAALVAVASSWLTDDHPTVARDLLQSAAALLVIALGMIFWRVLTVNHRHIHFRDDKIISHLWLFRRITNWNEKRKLDKKGPDYRHNTIGITQPLLESVAKSPQLKGPELLAAAARYKGEDGKGTELSLSIGCHAASFVQADKLLTDLAIRFLEQPKCNVQYLSCGRHPIEFLMQLRRAWKARSGAATGEEWKEVTNRIIAVDAYTAHFGFTDSIHARLSHQSKMDSIEIYESPIAYAGVHTAAMRAFKKIQKRSASGNENAKVRSPTLVIYECPHALADLESMEQYRIFLRHVLPSERLWGGMLTVVVETGAPSADLATLRSYVDVFLELGAAVASSDTPPNPAGEV